MNFYSILFPATAHITSYHSNSETNSQKFGECLENCIEEIKELLRN